MERQPVSSSNLAAVGYDPSAETLEVEFKNGSIYQYYNVPQVIFDQLVAAPSPGTYFNANVKNQFSSGKL